MKTLSVLLACIVLAPRAQADDPVQVRPSTDTIGQLRKASAEVANTVGEYLDTGHDWLYRRLQHLFENIDTRFAGSEGMPLVVPLSPLRIGLDSEYLHRQDGFEFAASPDFEATLRLPNLERRFKLFLTSTDLQESPGDPSLERNPVRAGVSFAARSHIDFDVGVRASTSPSAFAALKWTPQFETHAVHAYPFAKTYVESGLGLGVSGGIALERWHGLWMVRSASYANWLRDTSATNWSQTFVAGYARAVIQERRYDRLAAGHDLACGAVARVNASGDRFSKASQYEASVLFKRPLHGGWLYGYFEPLVRWERNSGWHPDAGIRLGFDALFWGLATLPGEVATYCQ